ncbi:hypothetical protein L211DRAFT_843012 [Terfezia boudieri ATCC MYA-4762]|uniref:ThuA-like domain-containing protein n=1 Tax=Terfezia boudieri ATCC MYA-4762 TaxID=1051890 RepID=A0A3N4L883_9PEZI|nr:hypothetical protein L211DRAFT_843012 [Terfezia boudieri ATCC MYA-4762]
MACPQVLPTVLVLALDEMTQNMSIDFLKNNTDVTFVTTESEASTQLQSRRFTAVFVADPIIVEESPNLRRQVTTFAKTGGRVILGHYFSTLVKFADFDKYMETEWDLPWRYGGYGRRDFRLNQQGVNLCREPGLPISYSMKAGTLQFVEPASKIYYPYYGEPEDEEEEEEEEEERQVEVHFISPEAGIAFARIGDGWLGYIGDVNNEEDTWKVILAMIGKA